MYSIDFRTVKTESRLFLGKTQGSHWNTKSPTWEFNTVEAHRILITNWYSWVIANDVLLIYANVRCYPKIIPAVQMFSSDHHKYSCHPFSHKCSHNLGDLRRSNGRRVRAGIAFTSCLVTQIWMPQLLLWGLPWQRLTWEHMPPHLTLHELWWHVWNPPPQPESAQAVERWVGV